MRKSLIIIIVLAAGFLITSMLSAHSSDQTAKKPDFKEASDECCHKNSTTPSTNGMIWGNISREFISVVFIPH